MSIWKKIKINRDSDILALVLGLGILLVGGGLLYLISEILYLISKVINLWDVGFVLIVSCCIIFLAFVLGKAILGSK